VTFAYDELNRLVETTQPGGKRQIAVLKYIYDQVTQKFLKQTH
jgi:hypothetical protein